jgi:hypothetical protein
VTQRQINQRNQLARESARISFVAIVGQRHLRHFLLRSLVGQLAKL